MEQGIVPSLELFQHVQEHHQYFQAILRCHAGAVLWETAQAALSRTIEQALTSVSAEKCSSALPCSVVSQYLAGSFLNLLKWWLMAEMPYTPEQMERIFQQLALPGVRAIFEEKEV